MEDFDQRITGSGSPGKSSANNPDSFAGRFALVQEPCYLIFNIFKFQDPFEFRELFLHFFLLRL